jgi:hypothetical protein
MLLDLNRLLMYVVGFKLIVNICCWIKLDHQQVSTTFMPSLPLDIVIIAMPLPLLAPTMSLLHVHFNGVKTWKVLENLLCIM